jgi:Carboxypeptidase regulatory-like domain
VEKLGLLLVSILCCALFAQNPASPVNPGSVAGRVVNSQTGDGVSGASLHLFPRGGTVKAGAQPANTVSLDDGSFRFDSVAPGTYILFATQSNYANGSTSAQTISVSEGSQVAGVTVQLNPLGSVSGKITDEQGGPVPGASLQLFVALNTRGKIQLRRVQNATANANGEYFFKRVAPRKYYIAADLSREAQPQSKTKPRSQPGNEPQVDTPDSDLLHMIRTFYPKAPNLESASEIEVTAGASLGDVNIQIQRAATFSIRGKIANLLPDGLQKNSTLELVPRDSAPGSGLGRSVRSQPDGSFSIGGVQSGSYTLWLMGKYASGGTQNRDAFITSYGGRRQRLLARQEVDVNGSNVDDVVLSLMPPVNLTGHFILQNAPVSANGLQLRISLQPIGQVAFGNFQMVTADNSGAFAVQDLAPGDYMVRVLNPPTGMYVGSITLNRQDVTTSGMDLSEGGGGDLEVTLKSGVGEVDGTLTANTGSTASGTAVLVPQTLAPDGSGVLMGAVAATGTFTIANVPPGHYFAFAVPQWTSIWQNVDFLREMQREGTSIELQANGHAQVELSLLSNDQLEAVASRLGLSLQ